MRRRLAAGVGVMAALFAVQAAAATPPSAPVIDVMAPAYALDPAPPRTLEALVRAATATDGGIDLPNISYSVSGDVQTVPLPAAAPALLLALAALGLLARRWKVG